MYGPKQINVFSSYQFDQLNESKIFGLRQAFYLIDNKHRVCHNRDFGLLEHGEYELCQYQSNVLCIVV